MIRSKFAQTLLALFFVAAVGYYFVSPYWALSSLQSAFREGDVDQIREAVDFPAVREGLKSQFSAKMAAEASSAPAGDNSLAGLGMLLAPAIIDRVLDTLVTPEGLASLIKEGRVREKPVAGRWPSFTVSSEYISLNTFRSTLTRDDKAGQIVLVLRRDGFFGWKLVRAEPSLAGPSDKASASAGQQGNQSDAAVATPAASDNNLAPAVQSGGGPTYSPQWLVGTWAEDGSCEGDAGETFGSDGTWGTWSVEGTWTLDDGTLTQKATMRVADTQSGKSEAINPPTVRVGILSAAGSDGFDITVDGKTTSMRRCD